MSTAFYNDATGEWVATRFNGGIDRGVCMDFGANPAHAMQVTEWCQSGNGVVDEGGNHWSGDDFLKEMDRCKWTFGEFGGTMEVGSGDIARFHGLGHLRAQWRTARAPYKPPRNEYDYWDNIDWDLYENAEIYRGVCVPDVRPSDDSGRILHQVLPQLERDGHVGWHFSWDYAAAGAFALMNKSWGKGWPVIIAAEVVNDDKREMSVNEAEQYDETSYRNHNFNEQEVALRPGSPIDITEVSVWIPDQPFGGDYDVGAPYAEPKNRVNWAYDRHVVPKGHWARYPIHFRTQASKDEPSKRWRWTHVDAQGKPDERANYDHKARRAWNESIDRCQRCGGRVAKEPY